MLITTRYKLEVGTVRHIIICNQYTTKKECCLLLPIHEKVGSGMDQTIAKKITQVK
jgi:hypothetical protein